MELGADGLGFYFTIEFMNKTVGCFYILLFSRQDKFLILKEKRRFLLFANGYINAEIFPTTTLSTFRNENSSSNRISPSNLMQQKEKQNHEMVYLLKSSV